MTKKDAAGAGRRVTLAHVAERAGVSRSAASFALNGRTDQRLSAETFARVRKAAEELGYRPNLTARTLRSGRSGTVALLSDYVSSTSLANSMVLGALEELRRRETLLFTVDTQGDPEIEDRLLQTLVSRDVDGVIYGSMFTRTVTLSPALRAQRPLVLLNCLTTDLNVGAVVPDEVAAGKQAAQVLLDAGHRNDIWFVGTFPSGMTGGAAWHAWGPLALPQRLEGVRASLAAAGVGLAGLVDVADDWDVASGRRAVIDLLSRGLRPRALVCITDAVAVGAYHALHRFGFAVPTDVSVVSFDGSPLVQVVEPNLTSLALPHEELGRRAAALVFEDGVTGVERVPMPLVEGGSVGPPAPQPN